MLSKTVQRCAALVNVCTRASTVRAKHSYRLPAPPFTCTQSELNAVQLPAAINPSGERYVGTLLVSVRCSSKAVLDSYCMFAEYTAQQLSSNPTITPGKITRSVMTVNRSPFIHGLHKDRFSRDLFNTHITLKDVSGSTADVFLEYLQRHMTEGMSMSVTEERLVEIDDTFMDSFYTHTNQEMTDMSNKAIAVRRSSVTNRVKSNKLLSAVKDKVIQ